MLLLLVAVVLCCTLSQGFMVSSRTLRSGRSISMEYIPDGISKDQWAAMKKKEADAMKGKDLGKVGITKFKSRSFEAWQKSGQTHLFPVDSKTTSLENRPYMQRSGGSADGDDLKKQGFMGMGQGLFSKKTEVDEKYDKLEKEGKLRSSNFSVPWTSSAANKQFSKKVEKDAKVDPKKAVKGPVKVLASAKKGAAPAPAPAPEAPKKKGFFGLF